jgi:hypothetical protein
MTSLVVLLLYLFLPTHLLSRKPGFTFEKEIYFRHILFHFIAQLFKMGSIIWVVIPVIIVPNWSNPSVRTPTLSKLENPIGPSTYSRPFFLPSSYTFSKRALSLQSSITSNQPKRTFFFVDHLLRPN